MNGEKGQALPLAIMALAFGMLVITPFLSHAGTNMISSGTYAGAITGNSACDAGVEHAIWNLTRGALAEQFSGPGDQVTYQLDEPINGLTTSVTVTSNATVGVGAGEIADSVIDTLEYDTADGFEPDIINISGSTYAIAYRGPGSDGFIKTVTIAANGDIGNSAIDSLEYDTSDGFEPDIINISGSTFAIAYRGPGSDGFIKTVTIAANGDIGNSAIDSLEYDTSDGFEPSITHVSGSVYAIAYRGPGSDGFIKTVTIAADGDIGDSVVDTLEFDTSNGQEPRIVNVSGSTFAIVYRGPGDDGFITTVDIAANGDIGNSVTDTLEFDTSNGLEPDIINISNSSYAVVYRGPGSDGFIKTVTIAANGDIGNSTIDTLEFDTTGGWEPRVINTSPGVYGVVYRGPGSDGFLKTISIQDNGDIDTSAIDTLEFDAADGFEPVVIYISGDIFAIAYRGPGSDGFVKTVDISRTWGSATWEIVATAGERSVRAYVETASVNASIISWRIE
ncbi:MAG: hypothetical protein A2Z29_06800 [Chloroflexi bacterium RBG_16_56_11]|nr:MAG: hypothetical protein A2Z29_06800 [Chloroflexi bacterium RBG_16_56_11]